MKTVQIVEQNLKKNPDFLWGYVCKLWSWRCRSFNYLLYLHAVFCRNVRFENHSNYWSCDFKFNLSQHQTIENYLDLYV